MRLRTLGIGALILGSSFAATKARAATACDPASLQCVTGTASFHFESKERLFTDIDTGSQGSGKISVRARFAIDPVGQEPTMVLDMPKGAVVEASWPDAGFITLKPITAPQTEGSLQIHYTLTPSLEASIYGFGVNYSAAQLAAKVGGSFNYDVTGKQTMVPWGFNPASLTMPAPAVDQSRIFQIPLSDLDVPTDLVEGTLAVNATTKPTFVYKTKSVRLDAGMVTQADGTTKIPATDADSMDITAFVSGEVTASGSMDVRPYVTVDTVDGYPTFGLVKFNFSVASKHYDITPKAVGWNAAQIHVPLPNIKVPNKPIDMGTINAGEETTQTITIDSTGELGGVLTITSSDPQFEVPSGSVRVDSKSHYDLVVKFKAAAGAAASADITVKSNDPDSPVQTFHVAANGAPLDPSNPDGEKSGGHGAGPSGGLNEPEQNSCACSTAGAPSPTKAGAFGVLGLGLAALLRRRRK